MRGLGRMTTACGFGVATLSAPCPDCFGQMTCGQWSPMPGPETGAPLPLRDPTAVYGPQYGARGAGRALLAGGWYTGAAPALANIARWDGSSWTPLGVGLNAAVDTILPYKNASGS